MKKSLILALLLLVLISCGGGGNNSLETVLESNDVVALQQKKDELTTQQQALNEQLKQLDEKINELNPEKNIPLVTTFVANDTVFNHYVELQGSVETKQNLVVTSEMGGILQRVYVKEGDKVSKGQLLAKVDDGGMSQQLAQMQVQADLAKTTFDRQKRLWDQKIGSEIQYLQAKSNYEAQQEAINSMKQQLGKFVIRAPFSGTIDDVITEQGSVVSPGQTPILRVVNLSDMYIQTDVPETYITNVTKGKDVEVQFPVLSKTMDAKIRQTGDFINPENRTFKVEITVPNKDKDIKPNLTARLRINDYTNNEAILIPQSIISENAEGEQYIYVLENQEDEKAVAKRVIIKTGQSQGDVIEVLEGLKAGDSIIQEGARSVKDGQTVKIITY
ncbi:MAG TPA: efflux RND transporter periplasmic adaptor subunit [Flavobacteriaceae bacterium]|jgi:RND family efflux transporter MFP subunit|nr:efflux RND transporter periplasmic adaptor subunit [Flavobacteriaceae bacterium]HIN99275.1 efflux RND transporter periplasmic adaptor subunit [Flavobacteriaceae bacterium]|tara:strand:- start:69157 stop:70323 length:1167 start_codon:yes stop_codon:yes gene_type:complete